MMKTKKMILIYITLLSFLFAFRIFSLELSPVPTTPPSSETETGSAKDGVTDEILPDGPNGFRDIELGMDIDEVKEILLKDPYFDYKGDPDVSFLPLTEQVLIECSGNSFVHRAYFQFYNEKLFIIIIELNQSRLDYYTMFTTLSNKYNGPSSLDPTEAVWLFKDVRLSLEKPLTIKYIDRVVFDEIKEAGKALEDIEELTREEFLEDF